MELETLQHEMEDQRDLVERVEEAEHAARAEERAARAEMSASATQTMCISRERRLPKLRSRLRTEKDMLLYLYNILFLIILDALFSYVAFVLYAFIF